MTKTEWCKENGILDIQYAAVELILGSLTDLELTSQYNAATAGWDLSGVLGFDKIKSLIEKNGTMREDTLAILGSVIESRIA